MNSFPKPMILLSGGDGARPAASVIFVGGPFDGLVREQSDSPDQIEAGEGVYRRSVRCADDGALRYVFDASDTAENADTLEG